MVKWQILAMEAGQDGLVTSAKYKASITDGNYTVETEGYCLFAEPQLRVPYGQLTSSMVVSWVKASTTQAGENIVEKRLAEQLKNKTAEQCVVLPWEKNIFTPKFEE